MNKNLWRKAILIRRTEERLLDLFAEGLLNGTLHTCIGQEFSGVAFCNFLEPDDWVFSNHRGHGHFIARTGDLNGLIAEIMGKTTGSSRGFGGSQHLLGHRFLSNGILGGMWPIAAGTALAENQSGSTNISLIFAGDGSLGEGIIYETLNLVSKWQIPLLVVVEKNGIAQSTNTSTTIAGDIKGRAIAFDIKFLSGSTVLPEQLLEVAEKAINYVRNERKPLIFELETARLKAHSKGDDTRSTEEIEKLRDADPIARFLSAKSDMALQIVADVEREVEDAIILAKQAPICKPPTFSNDKKSKSIWKSVTFESKQLGGEIYNVLKENLANNSNTYILGEDIEAPYGGAFKITRDLSCRFPGRVKNTPISEAAIVGVATGMGLAGFHPIVEIMFGDFTSLVFDQLIQHACKFRSMYGHEIDIPLIIRTPMGGRRGYGPTHSQSIEKFFIGIPNLTVIAINHRVPIRSIYEAAFRLRDPLLVIENKVLYGYRGGAGSATGLEIIQENTSFPWLRMCWRDILPTVTIFCYGEMLIHAEAALVELMDEHEISCQILCPTQISPLNVGPVLMYLKQCDIVVTCEEGSKVAAVSTELVAQLCELKGGLRKLLRLSFDGYIPSASTAESMLLPNTAMIVNGVVKLIKSND